jgi:polysaccharide export outer membrane protein
MRTSKRRPALVLLALLWSVPLTPPAWASSSYIVGAGDTLFVDFPLRGSPADLQPLGGNGLTLVIVGDSVFFRYEATVLPDGYITLPSMDPIRVNGQTLEQIRDVVASRLKTFALRNTVSVILAKPNSLAFVVTGAVEHPGRYLYERPTTLTEALAIAGGPTVYAKLNRIHLFREGKEPAVFDFTEEALEKNGLPHMTIQPSDVITVPRRWFTPDMNLVLIFFSAITAAVSIYAVTK